MTNPLDDSGLYPKRAAGGTARYCPMSDTLKKSNNLNTSDEHIKPLNSRKE